MKWTAWALSAFLCLSLYSTEFTVCSYNCGGLPDHYDYIRAACMGTIMHERYRQEAPLMNQFEEAQRTALAILFASSPKERRAAKKKWEEQKCSQFLKELVSDGTTRRWQEMSSQMVTPYDVRPIVIHDENVQKQLLDNSRKVTGYIKGPLTLQGMLYVSQKKMAKEIFSRQITHDIICLQETNYIDVDVLPKTYDMRFSNDTAIAWNRDRFELLDSFDSLERASALLLRDRESQESIFVASAHLSGCNPFFPVESDSIKGDQELQAVLDTAHGVEASVKVIAMDSNVTATHPRLKLLQQAQYTLDYTNHLEPTCTNPHVLLNTRIDWIAVGQDSLEAPSIANIPIFDIGLNSFRTNISDHAPIATVVGYSSNA